MADKSFLDVKVKELPSFLGNSLRRETAEANYRSWASRYTARYFGKAGSIRPMIHVMLVVGVLGYMLEYPHLKHETQRKYH